MSAEFTQEGSLAVLRYEKTRSARQVFTLLVAALVSTGVIVVSILLNLIALAIIYGVIAAMIIGLALLVRSISGSVYLTVTTSGMYVAILNRQVQWSAIKSLTVISYTTSPTGAAPAATQYALEQGGVNDGSKQINLIPHDPVSFAMLLGQDYAFRMRPSLAWEEPRTAGVNIELSAAVSPREFSRFVRVLAAEAARHGVPIAYKP